MNDCTHIATRWENLQGDGNVTFCPHFKYLGSWISFSLRDYHDVDKRIASVNASMGAMLDFGMTIMSIYTPSISYFAQFLATCFYGDVRVGTSDRHFWMLLKYSSTEV